MPIAVDISMVKSHCVKGYMKPMYTFDESRVSQSDYEVEFEILNEGAGPGQDSQQQKLLSLLYVKQLEQFLLVFRNKLSCII